MVRPLRASLLVSLASVLVACAQLLGIEDVPVPNDAAGDAPFDSVVGPDGNVPDGECNGGAEDCANGVDDNCNGLVDCADPVCQGAGYACVGPPPSGWTLVAFAAAAGSTLPLGCSGAYGGSATQGHMGLDASAPTCGCSCPQPQATGTTCGASTVQAWGGSTSCQGVSAQQFNLSPNACGNITSAAPSITASPGTVTALGSCGTPTPSKNVPAATWDNSYVACGYSAPADDGGCTTNDTCVRLPGSSFAAKPCIEQSGDVACPGAPYTNKTLFLTTLSDSRDCTMCSCTASGGACSASMTGYTGPSCTGTPIAMTADNQCTAQGAGTQSVHFDSQNVTPASCSKDGGAPTGAATASGPVTVCCP